MNPITSLVTVVFAVIGGLLFVAHMQLAAIGFGILAVLTLLLAQDGEQLGALRHFARRQTVEREGARPVRDHSGASTPSPP